MFGEKDPYSPDDHLNYYERMPPPRVVDIKGRIWLSGLRRFLSLFFFFSCCRLIMIPVGRGVVDTGRTPYDEVVTSYFAKGIYVGAVDTENLVSSSLESF